MAASLPAQRCGRSWPGQSLASPAQQSPSPAPCWGRRSAGRLLLVRGSGSERRSGEGGKAEDSQAATEVPDGEPAFVRGIARGLGAARWHVGTKHSHACR